MTRALLEADPKLRIGWLGPARDPAPRRISFWGSFPSWLGQSVDAQWGQLAFRSPRGGIVPRIPRLGYASLRSDRLLADTLDALSSATTHIDTRVQGVEADGEGARIRLGNGSECWSRHVFCSVPGLLPGAPLAEGRLMQSFFGFEVESESPRFRPDTATLMDFIGPREDEFVYVLPFDERRALVEPTRMSTGDPLDRRQALALLDRWVGAPFQIVGEESGRIPMQAWEAGPRKSPVTPIGVAAGCRKASTGYAFARSLRHAQALANAVVRGDDTFPQPRSTGRHAFLDRVLLRVLETRQLSPQRVFEALFLENDMERILRFLDEQTSVLDELPLIASLPFAPFLGAALGSARAEGLPAGEWA